jgi:Ca-activated chloride channel homolog
VLKAARIVPGSWARTVIDSDGGPLLLVGEREGRRIAVLSFDLHNSDLPLQVAFPLLLSNLMGFLAPGAGAEAAQLLPGQPLALQVDAQVSEVRVTRPDGSVASSRNDQVQIQAGQAIYAETDALGVYTIEEFSGNELLARRRFAVNLFTPSESRVLPERDLRITQTSGAQSTISRERDGRQEFWRWVALLALIILLTEWLVYQRNGLAYLRERWRSPNNV